MELTEKWLMETGGWQAMKAARSLWQAGAVQDVSYDDGVLRGVVRSAGKGMSCGLRIRGRTDVENLCTCFLARRDGRICEHSLAAGLGWIHRGASARSGVVRSAAASAAAVVVPEIVTASGPLRFQFAAGFMEGLKRGKLSVAVQAGDGDAGVDVPFLRWLAKLQQRTVPPHLMLGTGREVEGLLAALAGHPRVVLRQGKGDVPVEVGADPFRLVLRLKVAGRDEAQLQAEIPAGMEVAGAVSPGGSGWVWDPAVGRLRPLQIPPAFAELSSFRAVVKPRRWLAGMLSELQEWFVLDVAGSDAELLALRLEPAVPDFELTLEGSLERLAARLVCRYDGMAGSLEPGSGGSAGFPLMAPDRPGVFLSRNAAAEQAAVRWLERCGFTEVIGSERILRGEAAVLQFLAGELERMKRQWKVVLGSRFGAASAGVERVVADWQPVGSGQDWLAFDLRFVSSGGAVFDRAEIARMLATGTGHRRLPGGRTAVISLGDAADFNEVLRDVQPEQASGHFRVKKTQLAYLEQSFGRPLEAGAVGPRWTVEESVPRELLAMLRDYQRVGVQWLLDQAAAGFGGILADEMGLGKTLQSLAMLSALRRRFPDRPSLVVCPKSLLGNWQAEAARFVPELPVICLHGSGRAERFAEVRGAALVLTSYQLMARDAAQHQQVDWAAVVLDEAGFIRNPDTQAAKAAHRLRAGVRIALTGTPVENSVRDLWSILQFARPGYLGPREDFRERYELPLAAGGSAGVMQRLRRRMAPCLLRRLKQEVARDLPSKIETVVRCELTSGQRDLYAGLLREGAAKVMAAESARQKGQARVHMLTALLRLRQVCCDPRLLPGDAARVQEAASGKLEALAGLLDEIRDGGHSVLIFSAFASMLDLLEDSVREAGMEFCRLDGRTVDRAGCVESFQRDPTRRVFLISLKAGGYGLNLTKADTVIHFDPWWNPAVEAQATDRAHRIGQSRPVTVYKLISGGTVEEKILLLQAKKRGLMEAALDDEAPVMDGLSDDDLRGLLTESVPH